MICLDFQRRLTRWTMVSSCIKQDYGITGRLILWLFHILTKMQHNISKPVLSAPRFCPRPLTIFILFIDTEKGIPPSSKLVNFAYDTRVYVCINDIDKCNKLLIYLNSVYDSVHCKQHVFNVQKFNYVSFNGSMTSCSYNIYINPDMEIISPSRNVLYIYMSCDCTFHFHISSLSKKCANCQAGC